jgi:hypothetical protein
MTARRVCVAIASRVSHIAASDRHREQRARRSIATFNIRLDPIDAQRTPDTLSLPRTT